MCQDLTGELSNSLSEVRKETDRWKTKVETCVRQSQTKVIDSCRCDVCDCGQDDGRKTVSEQGVQRITSKETSQT